MIPSFVEPRTIEGLNVRHGVSLDRVAAQTFTTAVGALFTFDDASEDTDDYISVPGTTVTIPTGMDGLYVIAAHIVWASNATGQRVMTAILNGAVTLCGQNYVEGASFAGLTTRQSAIACIPLVAGDAITLQGSQSSGGDLTATASLRVYRAAA